MKQAPLTNMENRWVHSTKEAFDALVGMGYTPYSKDYRNRYFLFLYGDGIIRQVNRKKLIKYIAKQAYYHNGHFYDQPYEEFTITEEKVPFPELEDIEVKDGYLSVTLPEAITFIVAEVDQYIEKTIPIQSQYNIAKAAYISGFNVTWNLKENINRKMYENRALALAIGRYAEEKGQPVCVGDDIWVLTTMKNGTMLGYMSCETEQISIIRKATLPYDYIIPDQVLQWMKEYQEQGIK